MKDLQGYAHPVGRILMGLLFVMGGIGKFQMGIPAFAQFIESALPLGFLAAPIAIFELVAGLLLIVGYQTRWAALALAGFCVFTGVMYHQGMAEVTNLLKNIALAGGYLLLFAHGAGKWAIDKV